MSGGCCIQAVSPLVFDLDGSGFSLTNVPDGVWFTVFPGNPTFYRIAWTAADSHNAWLVLDRNSNGIIDDFSELFGDLTPQPNPPAGDERNGFLALAVFDSSEEGGNNDGWISEDDAIYSKLRLWQDVNHDGIAQPSELITLEAAGIKAISLDYKPAKKVDENGNVYRYRSNIKDDAGGTARKSVYDVFLEIGAARQHSSSYSPPNSFSDLKTLVSH